MKNLNRTEIKNLTNYFEKHKKKIENEYLRDIDHILSSYSRLKKAIERKELVCHIRVSQSGMTRWLNFAKNHNFILNFLYNQKGSFDPVKVGGCGMDMGFHLLYSATSGIGTKKWHDKNNLNFSRYDYI